MIRYAALSSSGLRFKSDSRDSIDQWCAEAVKSGDECEVYARMEFDSMGRPRDGVERVGCWRPIEAASD